MSNIKSAFQNGKAVIPFITCGYPDLETTGKIVRAAEKNGADLIELGIPFSDPTAEGPVIQEANIHALESGVTTDKIFDFIKELRKDVKIPLVFITYANVIFSYGTERFISSCAETGIDGIIVPDLPYEEKEEFLPACQKYGVSLISVIAPATEERIVMIAKEADTSFVRIASDTDSSKPPKGIITGPDAVVSVIKSTVDIPCISEDISEAADGRTFTEPIIELIAKHGKDAAEPIAEFIKEAKKSLNS